MRVDKLTTFEAEMLNRFLLHHMGQETRGRLMVEFPVIYRKLLGDANDSPFREAVKEAVLSERRVYRPNDRTVHVLRMANVNPEDLSGLPLAAPGVGKSSRIDEYLEDLEEDE
jgi:hypothetical protein